MLSLRSDSKIRLCFCLAINLHRKGATDTDDDPGLVEVDPYEEGSLPHVDVIGCIDDLGRIKVTNLNDTMIAIE